MNVSNLYHATQSNRVLKRLRAQVAAIARHEAQVQGLPLAQLRARLDALRQGAPARQRAAWLAEVFALVRECSRQVLGLRQHDVQMLGGLVLAEGKLAEMRTGEGKTLTIAAPCVAAALAGQCVHVVTVNEYLAQRDADTLRPLYEACGLTVGVIKSGQSVAEKQAAYACDVVYGVNFEFGFDYLRDNQVLGLDQRVQRTLGFAVVDEVDSVLIDEARTPLIISGMAEQVEAHERALDAAVRRLRQGEHLTVDEKERSASLNDAGYAAIEQQLVAAGLVPSAKALYAVEHLQLLQRVNQALAAHFVYRRDKHYVVRDGEVVIIDEATGRLMAGRRWGEGLHEAVEAKEGLTIKPPTQTQATITYQNFFGLYQTLSGLTGTAATEAEEFVEIYGLQTVVVPTHRPVARVDAADIVFPTAAQKFAAIVAEVAQRHRRGQPVLVGTGSVAESEHLSLLLQRAGIAHAVLNARQNAQEADVIAAAGMPGAVTVATNMAGRGTDVVLGGHPDPAESPLAWQARRDAVVAAGGLHVIGADRHESRRVDNQLRGRAGRQGDVGSSQFFISLEDRLLRVYATDRNAALAKLVSQPAGVSHPLVDKVVALAQKRLERQGFQARLELMKYDGALSAQRKALYALRNELLTETAEELGEHAQELAVIAALEVSREWLDGDWLDEENFDALGLKQALKESFDVSAPVLGWVHQEQLEPAALRDRVGQLVAARVAQWMQDIATEQARALLLQALDRQWVEHLTRLDELRAAIGLRTMAQQNPVYAFTRESKRMFEELKTGWAFAVVQDLKDRATLVAAIGGDSAAAGELNEEQRVQLVLFQRHVTRNEACPCGSGRRFKACHGRMGR
jgi:preprotein translocase subunit SecA